MREDVVPTAPAHTRSLVRGGALSLVGAVVSAGMGFLFILVLGRGFGPAGAGIVLQSIAVFTIALAVARAGLDTTAVWLLPRLREDRPDQLRAALVGVLLPTAALGCLVAAGLLTLCRLLTDENPPLTEAIQGLAWFLPAAAVMMVGLAATRGLGGVRPFVLVSSIAIPSLRPPLVAVAAAISAGTLGAGVAWAAPYVLGAVSTWWLLSRSLRGWEARTDVQPSSWPDRALRTRILSYSVPRSVATVLEQMMLWVDVLLVGLLAGPTAAGIYGAATRFVAAGRILSTAFRIVVAPTYSRLLGQGRLTETQSLYTTTTQWIVLFSTPLFVLYALFGETILTALGSEFRSGATALAILSIGLTIALLGGNIQVILLMGGHSGRSAANKAMTLLVLVGGILVMTPTFGIMGAATAWAVSMAVDFALAAWQVRAREGVRAGGGPVLLSLLIGVGAPGVPALASRLLLGDTAIGLAVGLVVGAVAFLAVVGLLRARLSLSEIAAVVRRRQPA